MNRTLLLGLDGLDHGFLTDHLDSLPALRQLADSGVWGSLQSTIPPATATAWTVALSGMSPARTGITGFTRGDPTTDSGDVVNASDIEVPRAWDVVESAGHRSAVVGVPVTSPVSPIDGVMVGGFLSSMTDKSRVYPERLSKELPDGYRFSISESEFGNDKEGLLDEMYRSTDAKFDLLETILKEDTSASAGPYDFICFVLSEIDWIQHYFLRPADSDRGLEGGETVLEYLKHVDDRLSGVLDLCEDRTICFLSDHGFGKCPTKEIFINQWMADEGYLVTVDDGLGTTARHTIGSRIRSIAAIPGYRYLKRFIPKSARRKALNMSEVDDDDIDWDESRAVFRQKFSNTGYISVNTIDDGNREALVDELITGLESLTDPQNGRQIVDQAYRREDYFSGPNMERLPDIVFVFEESYIGNEMLGGCGLIRQMPEQGRPDPTHRIDGVYGFVGPNIDSGKQVPADIHQFAPTLYSAVGLPHPTGLDGSPIEEVFVDGDVPASEEKSIDARSDFIDASRDSEEVRERLSDLGYL